MLADCTAAHRRAKQQGISFFQLYLYYSLVAANQTEPFRHRIRENEILIHETIDASATVNRPDGTFGFAYIRYHADQNEFLKGAAEEIEHTRKSAGLIPAVSGENIIHYSALPWLNFTALAHASHSGFKDSIPKISFGKLTDQGKTKQMPLAVSVHHGLMDALHVSLFAERFQDLLNYGN